MRNFFHSTKCKIILAILALVLGTMIYAVSVGGYTLASVSAFQSLVAPVQTFGNRISNKISYILELYGNAEDLYEENQQLKASIAELESVLVELEDAQSELAALQDFIGIKEEHEDYVLTAPCTVTGYVTNDPYCAFYIGSGTSEGVELYCPVVTEQGLVGLVTEVGEHTATVTTILSPDISTSCRADGEEGIMTGTVALALQGLCMLDYLAVDTTVEPDSIVTTKGSGIFPKGYVVGYVREILPDSTNLTSYAVIEPAVDVSSLTQVIVITDFEGKGESDETE